MWLIHHVSENLILNQGCSQKYNNNEDIHVDNRKIITLSATLVQWGERSPSARTAQVHIPVRPDKTYTVFCLLECPYKINSFRDYSVYLCI